MPKPCTARRATARPIRPMPKSPSVLPYRSTPIRDGASVQAVHDPDRTKASASGSRRATASISATVEVCRRLGQDVRRVRDRDPEPPRDGQIDVVDADRDVGDDLQLRIRLEHRLVQPVGEQAHHAVIAREEGRQLGRAERLVGVAHVDLDGAARERGRHRVLEQPLGHEKALRARPRRGSNTTPPFRARVSRRIR